MVQFREANCGAKGKSQHGYRLVDLVTESWYRATNSCVQGCWWGSMAKVEQGSGEPKEKHQAGYSSLDAIDANDGGKWQVLLSHTKMDYVA